MHRHVREISGNRQAGFRDDHAIGGNELRQAAGRVQGRFKGVQIAIVDPDHLAFEQGRTFELWGIVYFDQNIHAPVERSRLKLLCLAVRDRGHDDQDTIRPQSARLGNLIGVVHEILAQRGQGAGGASLGQKGLGALEAGRVGQHRQTCRPACGIGLGQGGGIEVFSD